jgi:hypothetical protein
MSWSFPECWIGLWRLEPSDIGSFYNFARIHKTLRITPSMAAGLSDHVWSLEEIALMADNYMPRPPSVDLTNRGLITHKDPSLQNYYVR